jgi:hypothetical protein
MSETTVAEPQIDLLEQLRELCVRKPFVSYTIVTKDGTRYRIRTAMAAAANDRGIFGYAEGHNASIRLRWEDVERVELTPSEWATMEGDYLC